MAKYMTFDGKRYLMRDQRSKKEILQMWKTFHKKYPMTTFEEWLNRGRIYMRLDK